MLEILILGVPIHLPADISLDLIIENPFMLQDRIPSPYSLDFALPATPPNLARFNHPNRIASVLSYEEIEGVSVKDDGIGITSGVLVLDTFDGNINVFYRGSAYIEAKEDKTLLQLDMQRYTMPYCGSPEEVTDETGFYPTYAELLASAVTGTPGDVATPDFAVGPLRVEFPGQFFSTNDEAVTRMEFLKFCTNQVMDQPLHFYAMWSYLNMYNPTLGKFRWEATHMPTIPFPYIGYLFDVIFRFKLNNNLFKEGDFAKLVSINVFNPNITIAGWYTIDLLHGAVFDNGLVYLEPYFQLNTCSPNYYLATFLKEVLKYFCITIIPSGTGFDMVFNKDILHATDLIDWTALVTEGGAIIAQEVGQTYGSGCKNQKTTEDVITVYVDHYNDMLTYLPETDDLYFKINDTKEIFHRNIMPVDGSVLTMFRFECVDQGLGLMIDGDYSMQTDITPVEMNIDKYWMKPDATMIVTDALVPIFRETRYTRPEKAMIAFNHGLTDISGSIPGEGLGDPPTVISGSYPLISGRNYAMDGTKLCDLSLAWDGDDGVFNTYHAEYAAWIGKNKKLITVFILLNALALRNLDLKKKYNIKGVNFYIKKVSVSIKLMHIELAQVDLIEC